MPGRCVKDAPLSDSDTDIECVCVCLKLKSDSCLLLLFFFISHNRKLDHAHFPKIKKINFIIKNYDFMLNIV